MGLGLLLVALVFFRDGLVLLPEISNAAGARRNGADQPAVGKGLTLSWPDDRRPGRTTDAELGRFLADRDCEAQAAGIGFELSVSAMVATRFVWLTTLGKLKRGGTRVDADLEALTPSIVRQLQAAGLPSEAIPENYRCVLGLASIQPCCAYDHMVKLSTAEREQLHYWQSLADCCMSGMASRFKVVHSYAFTEVHRLQQLSERKFRGLVCSLEDGQEDQLFATLGGAFIGLPAGSASIVVRLPAPFARLIAAGAWTSCLLPQLPPAGKGSFAGTTGLGFNWDVLRLDRPAQPQGLLAFQESDLALTADIAIEIADALRDLAATLPEGHAYESHVCAEACRGHAASA